MLGEHADPQSDEIESDLQVPAGHVLSDLMRENLSDANSVPIEH